MGIYRYDSDINLLNLLLSYKFIYIVFLILILIYLFYIFIMPILNIWLFIRVDFNEQNLWSLILRSSLEFQKLIIKRLYLLNQTTKIIRLEKLNVF